MSTRIASDSQSGAASRPITQNTPHLPQSAIPILTTLASLRAWRNQAFAEDKSVGFVPTMGALHDGHLSLVTHSLSQNDLTILSIFVNPTQFAPHEDLATYPRTLPRDLELLAALSVPVPAPGSREPRTRTPSAVFLPSVDEMYPSAAAGGGSEGSALQKGTFVEVKGFGEQMEGRSRPTFFRGVATVVTKLFNAVQPTHAYFGQKDIQQALLLRHMCRDLLTAYPPAHNVHIVPSARDAHDGLALSSRNAYLLPRERAYAPTLYRALCAGARAWAAGGAGRDAVVACARGVVEEAAREARAEGAGVVLELDYVEMNDPGTFEVVVDGRRDVDRSSVFVLSGAMVVGKTRLIDNKLLGDVDKILF